MCGTRLYEIIDRGTNAVTTVATVQTVSAGNYKIRAHSALEAQEGTHNLFLRVTFVSYPLATNSAYPKAQTDFIVQIT